MREPGVNLDEQAEGLDGAARLAQRAVAREPEAWRELFELHYRTIYAFVRYRLRGTPEAEDIAAHVFEVAYVNAARFDYRGVPIEAWLMGIARNLCRDAIKKAARHRPESELIEGAGPAEPDQARLADLRQDLANAMRALTEDQQEVLSLRFLLDRSVEETARIMNRSEDAVKNLQRRALAAMQRALAGAGYPGAGS